MQKKSFFPMDLIDNTYALMDVMAWCRKETCHDLSQFWVRSMTPYCVNRHQWFNHFFDVTNIFVFLSFLKTETAWVVEFLPCGRCKSVYQTFFNTKAADDVKI